MSLISVIVPIHNAADFIEETIASVSSQSYEHWELVLVNDGSTDDTSKILNRIKLSQSIRIIHQKENVGVSISRNVGAKSAKGSYLCFLDADDILHPSCLSVRSKVISKNPKALVHNDIQLIDSKGRLLGVCKYGLEGLVLDDLLLWERTVIPGPSSIIVSREVFENVGGFDAKLSTAADQDFFIRVASMYPVIRIPQVLTNYRIHDKNMHKNIGLMEKDHRLVYHKAIRDKRFRSWPLQRKCISNLYLMLAANWWGDGKSKLRAFYFIFLSLLQYPPVVNKILRLFFRK